MCACVWSTECVAKWHSVVEDTEEDNILHEQDVRYWMLASSSAEATDMESSVLQAPHDTHMWLRLAYKKMYDHRRYTYMSYERIYCTCDTAGG